MTNQGRFTPETAPRQAAMVAIDDLLFTTSPAEALEWYNRHWESWEDLIRDPKHDISIAHDLFSTYSEEDHTVAKFGLENGATVEITKDERVWHFLGKALRSRIHYIVTAEYTDLAFSTFPKETPYDIAPQVGYERWEFDSRRPRTLMAYHRSRRYDHYEEHGNERLPLRARDYYFNEEFDRIVEVVGEAKSIINCKRNNKTD